MRFPRLIEKRFAPLPQADDQREQALALLRQHVFLIRVLHCLGKTHHQLLLAVNCRERTCGEERLHYPIAQQEESSGEDRMSEPPHVVPRTCKDESKG